MDLFIDEETGNLKPLISVPSVATLVQTYIPRCLQHCPGSKRTQRVPPRHSLPGQALFCRLSEQCCLVCAMFTWVRHNHSFMQGHSLEPVAMLVDLVSVFRAQHGYSQEGITETHSIQETRIFVFLRLTVRP